MNQFPVYQSPFYARPFMKENGFGGRTCNDDGLCRMLYFSDD